MGKTVRVLLCILYKRRDVKLLYSMSIQQMHDAGGFRLMIKVLSSREHHTVHRQYNNKIQHFTTHGMGYRRIIFTLVQTVYVADADFQDGGPRPVHRSCCALT